MRIRNNDISLHNEERNPAEGIYTPRAQITNRKNRNTNDNLSKLVQTIKYGFTKNKKTTAIF